VHGGGEALSKRMMLHLKWTPLCWHLLIYKPLLMRLGLQSCRAHRYLALPSKMDLRKFGLLSLGVVAQHQVNSKVSSLCKV
jgi:hypothetical protein